AVLVEAPLLVVLAVAVPDDHAGAVGRAVVVHVEALAAVDTQLPGGRGGPLLVALPVAVPDLHRGPVGLGHSGDVEAPSRPHALDAVGGDRRSAADAEDDGAVGRHARRDGA